MSSRQQPHSPARRGRRPWLWALAVAGLAMTLWLGLWPWTTYTFCGTSQPDHLPATVRIGLYEEFPTRPRLEKLRQVDFPVRLAVAATSREEFKQLEATIAGEYPQVEEVFFWPLLTLDEGYYPGTWSNAQAIKRMAEEADGLPTLWDLEWPRQGHWYPGDWSANRVYLDQWLKGRRASTHIWRLYSFMGLSPRVLRLTGMHFDPSVYPVVTMHLDLYAIGSGLPDGLLNRVMRCGVEQYGERFVPSLGVLNDSEGSPEQFIPTETLTRYLAAARNAGVSEIWIFGANGLNTDYLAAIRTTLPLEPLPALQKE